MAQEQYDAIIVGSGAGGGMAAKVLAESGFKVAILEAGGDFDPAKDEYRTQLRFPWESPRRGGSSQRVFGDFDAAWGGWELEGEPYTRAAGTRFDWFRSRMLGGRTNHWGRISLRFGPKDFKRKNIDGLGENWPIGYDDVKPYYDRVDKMIGVFGTNEGLPNDPDGFFLRPPKPRLHELFFMRGAQKIGIPVYPNRLSILTQRINDDRGLCFFCNQCNRACSAYADFSSGTVLIHPAKRTGKLDLYLHAMVRAVTTDSSGKATGVSYISKSDRKEYQIKGKVVLLGASACESARILLNSQSSSHPQGIGNQGGHVGRYLHDSTGADRSGIVTELIGRKRYNEDGTGGAHIYSPWWLDGKKLDFPRGYHIEYWGGMGMPGYGFGGSSESLRKFVVDQAGNPSRNGGYGSALKRDVRSLWGATIGMSGRGESVPQYSNFCEIDSGTVDQWGIPVLRFHYKWTDYERMQAKHMHDTFEELLTAAGATLTGSKPGPENDYGLHAPGRIIHEVGTTRMGDDPNTSVTDRYGRTHDCDNVYVVDAGTFVSQADKNPTWTILALAWRTAEHVVDRFNRGELS